METPTIRSIPQAIDLPQITGVPEESSMPDLTKDGFKFFDWPVESKCFLVIESSRLRQCIDYCNTKKIRKAKRDRSALSRPYFLAS